jgi:glutaredoxin
MMEVVIYSKPGCHLCDIVKAQLERLRESMAFELREVNILEDAASFEKFEEEIPVVFMNGRKSFKYRLDERDFARRAQAILNQERNPTHGT